MTTWIVQVAMGVLFALACGALYLAWRRGRLGIAAVVLLVVALVVWAAEVAALVGGFGDAAGFASCSSECRPAHYVSAVAFLVPPLLAALSAAAMLVAVGTRIRVRRAQAKEVAG